jgi:hypothetical protein
MQRVTEQVDAAYLEQAPPRPLQPMVILNLFNDHIFDRPLQTFLDPVLIASVIVLILLFVMRSSTVLRLAPLLLIIFRLIINARRIWRLASEDLALLRDGLTIRAHVLRLRPHRTTMGDIDGALLDCAIPVAPRRTYVGSIWLSDSAEALRLARAGRVDVLCLPRTPGTWRVIEDVKSNIRYDRIGPMKRIPQDA